MDKLKYILAIVGGAMAAYGIFNAAKIRRGINKFLYGECNET